MKYIFCLFVVCLTLEVIVCPPVDQKKKDTEKKQERETSDALDEYGLEYGRYLQQVVQALEEDKDFAKKLENISAEHIRSGHIAKELEFVKHNVRSKLDELKRMEVDRLRKLLQQQMERTELGLYRDGDGHLLNSPDGRRWRTIPSHRSGSEGLDRKRVKIPSHLDIENPHSFEIEDLKKLIQTATSDLEELDKKRREEFKQYEMEKEAKYRESLKNMTEEEKKETEKHHEEMIEKHKDHPRIHHPGSKPQLEQVWEEQDHMPKEEFNPKTFFAMHDVNGDGHLDVQEVEAILIPEVKKLYNPNNEEDDPAEMEEEFHRMREHVFNETDKNKDGLISLEEFLKMTEQQDFQKDEGWKDLDEQTVFSDAELEEFMRHRAMYPPEYAQHGDPRAYYNIPNAPMQGVPPHINYQVPPGGMPPQPGYPQGQNFGAPPQGHPQYPPQQQQYQGGHPQQQFQAGYPQQQQQFQGGHPQQQQFQGGHPQQQQQFQGGHPQQQQFQGGHPQQPQFQGGYPQQPQFQGGQPQQQYPSGQQQYPAGQQQQHPSGQQQQYPSGQQQQQQHLGGNQQVQQPNIQGVASNKALENNEAVNKNAPDASNSINQIPNNVKPNVPEGAAAQAPASNKQVPPQTKS
ncbi:nucleobindin-2-like isoform X2 [Uloborus diversus]|uniref:nucleobindin-2-like isoform X2 n=1 Tax=Uloborus diversus TaxID=327109 RepID=UPI00240A6E5F|nr:nucleobindin-2-like isoform X2 [Uloborus diversus]